MAKRLPFVVYDTMTSAPFTGNPTPVFIISSAHPWLPETTMQLIARELNHTETVFVRRRPNAPSSSFDIRWYTPLAEEPFCGHGIVGATHALHASGFGSSFSFTTRSEVQVRATVTSPSQDAHIKMEGRDVVTISMSFPASPMLPSLALSSTARRDFAAALRIEEPKILAIGQNELKDVIIEVDSSLNFACADMTIDPVAILNASPAGTRSQVITSSWSKDAAVDFAKRVFAYGVEDQATGSTYAALAPYWGSKLLKSEMTCLQPSWRGGGARVKLLEGGNTVEVLAESVKCFEGSFTLPNKQFGAML